MSDTLAASTEPREDPRRRWLTHAAAAFDLMFHPDHQADLVTFDQRETRACELGRDLTTWLIQQHANADELARPAADRQVHCPKCGRPARCKTDPGEPPPGRPERRGRTPARPVDVHGLSGRVFPPGP
jgi:hypothetical protein